MRPCCIVAPGSLKKQLPKILSSRTHIARGHASYPYNCTFVNIEVLIEPIKEPATVFLVLLLASAFQASEESGQFGSAAARPPKKDFATVSARLDVISPDLLAKN